jgi:hypothetical protein
MGWLSKFFGGVSEKPDPNAPVFELFVGDTKVAHMHDPKREEMFWCSYRLAPVSEDADRILHDEATWNEVRFIVRARDGRVPNAHTFTGGDFVLYCRRETDRLSFRSLWPIDA